jgi:ABC-type transport system involved in cytochrome bd biosynthesis fused ATPase/permease subunit
LATNEDGRSLVDENPYGLEKNMARNLTMRTKKATRKEIVEALRLVTISFIDLVNGWPQKELHELPEKTRNRCGKVLKAEGIDINECWFERLKKG